MTDERPGPAGVRAWLDSRTGYSALLKVVLDEPIPGGARWWYTLGAVLTFLLAVEDYLHRTEIFH